MESMQLFVRRRSSTSEPDISEVSEGTSIPSYVLEAVRSGKVAVSGDEMYSSSREKLAAEVGLDSWD